MCAPEMPFAPVTIAVRPCGASDRSGRPWQIPFEQMPRSLELAVMMWNRMTFSWQILRCYRHSHNHVVALKSMCHTRPKHEKMMRMIVPEYKVGKTGMWAPSESGFDSLGTFA